jgi:cysteine desulfurase/selenocysteine lyase
MYEFSERATGEYELARSRLAHYLGVKNSREIVFLRGTTEAINLVAHSYGRKFLSNGDEIIIGAAEHHANYLPWQVLEREIGIVHKIIPLDENYDLDIERYEKMFSSRTKFVAIQHVGNVLGNVNDIGMLVEIAHRNGAKILIDGASSLASKKIDLEKIDCDFFACSGHKCFGPMGSGFLFGKYDLLSAMPPYHTGGNMVNRVHFEETSFKLPPDKFEAGTPDVAAVIGLGESINFLETVDMPSAQAHLHELTAYLANNLRQIPGTTIYGNPRERSGALAFNLRGIHSHDVATYLASEGIAVRAGTHCAQPLMQILKTSGTVRISLCLYNTKEEIDATMGVLRACIAAFHE